MGTDATSPYSVTWGPVYATGTRNATLTAVAVDNEGLRTTSTPVRITILEAPACTYTLSPTSRTLSLSGGTGSINVAAPSGSNWTAVSNVPWINITPSTGSVNYTVASNAGAPRVGTITVAGQTFTLNQGGTFASETIGVFRPAGNIFFLRNTNTTGFPDISVPFGAPGDLPIAGDWDGDGDTTIGLYRPSTSTFFLRNSNTAGFPDLSIPYGAAGDKAVVGDWDGNGTTTIGLYRSGGSIFFLRNTNSTGGPDLSVPYGASGDMPVAADWDGL